MGREQAAVRKTELAEAGGGCDCLVPQCVCRTDYSSTSAYLRSMVSIPSASNRIDGPSGAFQHIGDLLITEGRVLDNHSPNCGMRLRCAGSFYDPDANELRRCLLDFAVLAHVSSLIRGIANCVRRRVSDLP